MRFTFITILLLPWCDTDSTADYTVSGVKQLIKWVEGTYTRHVVLTGGEPLMQNNIFDLIVGLLNSPWVDMVHIETNGTQIFPFDYSKLPEWHDRIWLTVSPKPPTYFMRLETEVWGSYKPWIKEMKFVVDEHLTPDIVRKHISDKYPVYLQPCWPHTENFIADIHKRFSAVNGDIRLGIQAHKYWKVD